MAIWAIADLHLSFGVPDKKMDVFGDQWIDYSQKIETHWRSLIHREDLVLIAGDISWAMKTDEAKADLEWIDRLPGTKVMIKGNHDYWWSSLSKLEKILPSSIHIIQNNTFHWNNVAIGGARMWDSLEYQFSDYIIYKENPRENSKTKKLTVTDPDTKESERLFERELSRLELSLKTFSAHATQRIVMTHYPPISATLSPSRISNLLEKYKVDICVFGHLHNVKQDLPIFGQHNGISYYLTSCDYLNFIPLKIS